MFITVFTEASHSCTPTARRTQSTIYHSISLRSVSILSSHLHPLITSNLFPSCLIFSPVSFIPLIMFGAEQIREAALHAMSSSLSLLTLRSKYSSTTLSKSSFAKCQDLDYNRVTRGERHLRTWLWNFTKSATVSFQRFPFVNKNLTRFKTKIKNLELSRWYPFKNVYKNEKYSKQNP